MAAGSFKISALTKNPGESSTLCPWLNLIIKIFLPYFSGVKLRKLCRVQKDSDQEVYSEEHDEDQEGAQGVVNINVSDLGAEIERLDCVNGIIARERMNC